MPDALPDTTLPISRLETASTNGSNNGGGWGKWKMGRSSVKNFGHDPLTSITDGWTEVVARHRFIQE
jgi:hypothetical protein